MEAKKWVKENYPNSDKKELLEQVIREFNYLIINENQDLKEQNKIFIKFIYFAIFLFVVTLSVSLLFF